MPKLLNIHIQIQKWQQFIQFITNIINFMNLKDQSAVSSDRKSDNQTGVMADSQSGKLSRVGIRQSKMAHPDSGNSQKSSMVCAPQIKPQILRSKATSGIALPVEQLGGSHNGRELSEKIAKASNIDSSQDRLNQTQPLKLQNYHASGGSELRTQLISQLEKHDDVAGKSVGSGNVEMSVEMLRPVGQHYKIPENLEDNDEGQFERDETSEKGQQTEDGGGLNRMLKQKSAIIKKSNNTFDVEGKLGTATFAPKLRVQVHGGQAGRNELKQARYTDQGLTSIQQSDTEDFSELPLTSSQQRRIENKIKVEGEIVNLHPPCLQPDNNDSSAHPKQCLKDYTKYLDEKLSKNSNVYKPPVVEKRCLSTFSIKPAVKEDLKAKIKEIQSKYNLPRTKIEVTQQVQSPSNQHQTFLRTSYNLKSLHTFEKVESLLNLNQPSSWQIAAEGENSMGRRGSKDVMYHARSPEPYRTSGLPHHDELQSSHHSRARGGVRSLTRSMLRADAIRASSNQSAEWQDPIPLAGHLYPHDNTSKTKQTMRPSSSGPGTSLKQHPNLSASFNFSKQSTRIVKNDQVMRSSHKARICTNNTQEDQIMQMRSSNDEKLNIMSNEMDLTSVTGIQPAGTLFYSNQSQNRTKQAEYFPKKSVIDDGTVEHLDTATLDPAGFPSSNDGQEIKARQGVYSFGRRSINKTLISIKNYDGHTVPRQPHFKRMEKRYSPIRILDSGHTGSTMLVHPDTMENEECMKRQSRKTSQESPIRHDAQPSRLGSVAQYDKENNRQVSVLALRQSIPDKIKIQKDENWGRAQSIDEPQTALMAAEHSNSSVLLATKRKGTGTEHRADENTLEHGGDKDTQQQMDKSDLLASDHKQEALINHPKQAIIRRSTQESRLSKQQQVRQSKDTNQVQSQNDIAYMESQATIGEMGVQGTRMQFIEVEKLAQQKMLNEIVLRDSRKFKMQIQNLETFHPKETIISPQTKDKNDTRYKNRKVSADPYVPSKKDRRRKQKIVANGPGSPTIPLPQPAAPLKELHSPENTMLASCQDSQRSCSLSPCDSNVDPCLVDRIKQASLPLDHYGPSKKIIDIHKRGNDTVDCELNQDMIQSPEEYMIMTQNQTATHESKQTVPISDVQQQLRKSPVKHTLKKRAKSKAEEAQRQKLDRKIQQEKVRQAKARQQCRSRESAYIKRQKILTANPARNRYLAAQRAALNKSSNQHEIGKKCFQDKDSRPLSITSKDANGERDASQTDMNSSQITKLEPTHNIPVGVIVPSTQAHKDDEREEFGITSNQAWQQSNKQKIWDQQQSRPSMKKTTKATNLDIMMDLQMRHNKSNEKSNDSTEQKEPTYSRRQRKKSFVIYHQAIENQQANFLIVEESSKDKDKEGINNSRSKSDRSQSPYSRNFQSNHFRRPKTSNRYMMPFQKYVEKIQTKNNQIASNETPFSAEHDMLISSPASTSFVPKLTSLPAAVLRQARIRDEQEDRIFRIPTPMEQNSPTELVTPTNFSLRTAPYSQTGIGQLHQQYTETVEITEVVNVKRNDTRNSVKGFSQGQTITKERSKERSRERGREKSGKSRRSRERSGKSRVQSGVRQSSAKDAANNPSGEGTKSQGEGTKSAREESADPKLQETEEDEQLDPSGDVHILDRSRERYLKETRQTAFKQSQKHLKVMYLRNGSGLGQKSTQYGDKEAEFQFLQNQFGLLADGRGGENSLSTKANKLQSSILPAEIEMILLNDSSLRVRQMKPEQLSVKLMEKSSNQVISDGISFSVLSPNEDRVVQISTRPKTSHIEQDQKRKHPIQRQVSQANNMQSMAGPENTTFFSKMSKENMKQNDILSQQFDNENAIFYHISEPNERQLSNDNSTSAAATQSNALQPVFTSYGTHGFFPTRKQSVILQSSSLRNIQQLNQIRREHQRKEEIKDKLIVGPGKIDCKHVRPATQQRTSTQQRMTTQLRASSQNRTSKGIWRDTSGSRVIRSIDRDGGEEIVFSSDNGTRIHLHKPLAKPTQDAQTGVYLVSQGFGIEGVVLSSQQQDTVNQSSIRAWAQKPSISPRRSLAIDHELPTAKSSKSVHPGCPSPISRKLASTLDDRKEVGSLLRDKESIPQNSRSKEGGINIAQQQNQGEVQIRPEPIEYVQVEQKTAQSKRIVSTKNRHQRSSGKLRNGVSFTDLARQQSGNDVHSPSHNTNSRLKSHLGDHAFKTQSSKNIVIDEANKNKDLAHLVTQGPDDTRSRPKGSDSVSIHKGGEQTNGIHQDILDERKRIMQLANEDIDVEGEVHRNKVETRGQIREQLREGRFKVDMLLQAELEEARNQGNNTQQAAYRGKADVLSDDNSSQISDILRSKQIKNKKTSAKAIQNKRNSQISLTIKTKQSSRGKATISEVNVVMPQETVNSQNEQNQRQTQQSQMSEQQLEAQSSQYKSVTSPQQAVGNRFRCMSPELSEVEQEILQRIQQPSSLNSIFSPKQGNFVRPTSKTGIQQFFQARKRIESATTHSAQVPSPQVPQFLQTSNQILPKVHHITQGSRLAEQLSPQSLAGDSRMFHDPPTPNHTDGRHGMASASKSAMFAPGRVITTEGYIKLTQEERELRYYQMLEAKSRRHGGKKKKNQVENSEYGRKLRSFLSGVNDRGGILSSKVPQLDMVKRKKKGHRARTKDQTSEGLEEVFVQVNDPTGRLMRFRRSIKVDRLINGGEQLINQNDLAQDPLQDRTVNVQTLLGRHTRESSRAAGTLSQDGKLAYNKQQKSDKVEERRISDLRWSGADQNQITQNREQTIRSQASNLVNTSNIYRQLVHNKQSALRQENSSVPLTSDGMKVHQSSMTNDSKALQPMSAQYNAYTLLTTAQQLRTNSISSSFNNQGAMAQNHPLFQSPPQLSPVSSGEQQNPQLIQRNQFSPVSSLLQASPDSARKDRQVVKVLSGGDQTTPDGVSKQSESMDKQLILDEKYQIGPVMEKGRCGDLRHVVDRITGQKCWLKVICKEAIGDDERVKQIEEGLKKMKSLKHATIQKIREWFEDESRFYVVMEGIKGAKLMETIGSREDGVTELDVQLIMKQLLQAIDQCHTQDIFLQNLRPENLYLEEGRGPGRVKLVGLGSSFVFAEDEPIKAHWTPAYWLAPETHAKNYSDAKLGPEVDLWRCGILANILLVGTAPFEGANDAEILEKARQGKFQFQADAWRSVSYDAKDFISQLLAADPSKRLTSSQALKHAWLRKACDMPIARKVPSLDPKVIGAFRQLSSHQLMREAIVTMILNIVRAKHDLIDLKALFKLVDDKSDTMLSVSKLTECFVAFFGQTFTASHFSSILPIEKHQTRPTSHAYPQVLAQFSKQQQTHSESLFKNELSKIVKMVSDGSKDRNKDASTNVPNTLSKALIQKVIGKRDEEIDGEEMEETVERIVDLFAEKLNKTNVTNGYLETEVIVNILVQAINEELEEEEDRML